MLSYNANNSPKKDEWLAASNDVKVNQILSYHNSIGDYLGYQPYLHVFKHLAVENLLAESENQSLQNELKSLIQKGYTRHEALHELFKKVNLKKLSEKQSPYDVKSIALLCIIGIVLIISESIFENILLIISGVLFLISALIKLFMDSRTNNNRVYKYVNANSGLYTLYKSYLDRNDSIIKEDFIIEKFNQFLEDLDYSNYEKECPICAEKVKIKAKVCRYCKQHSFSETEVEADLLKLKGNLFEVFKKQMQTSEVSLKSNNWDHLLIGADKEPSCIYCGSKHIEPTKKGYGFVKGITGLALVGPIGAFGGFVGSRKIQMSCLSCGRQWNLKASDLS